MPSLFDPLLAPSPRGFGPHHVLRWESWASFNRDWSRPTGRAYAERCFELWCHYTPNLEKARSRVRVAWTPHDIERQLPSMKRGSIKHGAYTSLQMGYDRPLPECSGDRTPIEGLYLAGSSVHPSGMVTLGAGYNAARIIAKDLGAPRLPEVEMVQRARERGYLDREED